MAGPKHSFKNNVHLSRVRPVAMCPSMLVGTTRKKYSPSCQVFSTLCTSVVTDVASTQQPLVVHGIPRGNRQL